MKLSINTKDKNELERLLLIINIGIGNTLLKGLITVEDAETLFYNPRNVKKLSSLNINNEIVKLVHLGCEL